MQLHKEMQMNRKVSFWAAAKEMGIIKYTISKLFELGNFGQSVIYKCNVEQSQAGLVGFLRWKLQWVNNRH